LIGMDYSLLNLSLFNATLQLRHAPLQRGNL